MPGRPGNGVMPTKAGAFIRLTSLALIWATVSPPPIVAQSWSGLSPDSIHQATPSAQHSNDGVPQYYYEASRHHPPPPPPPPPPVQRRKQKRKGAPPPPHGIKATKVKRRERKDKKRLKSARTVGYFFAGIAMLLQVAVVVFLVIKRKQMIGVVCKYDEAHRPEWNGVQGSV